VAETSLTEDPDTATPTVPTPGTVFHSVEDGVVVVVAVIVVVVVAVATVVDGVVATVVAVATVDVVGTLVGVTSVAVVVGGTTGGALTVIAAPGVVVSVEPRVMLVVAMRAAISAPETGPEGASLRAWSARVTAA
jgi:hypothetical protein